MTDYLSCNPHYIVGEKRAEYARIAGERCADGASMRVIAEELGRSYSCVQPLFQRDPNVHVRPASNAAAEGRPSRLPGSVA